MLPVVHRITRHSEFSTVMRSGRRAGRSRVVVQTLQLADSTAPCRVGLIVSRKVGGSVVRHSVSRKLRHVMRELVAEMPAGSLVVLRALASASTASSADLDTDIRSGLRKLGMFSAVEPA